MIGKKKHVMLFGAFISLLVLAGAVFGVPSRCDYSYGDIRDCHSIFSNKFWEHPEWAFELDDDL